MLGRKDFITLAAAFAAGVSRSATVESVLEAGSRRGSLRLKAGIFTDLHITNEKSAEIVEKTLRYFRDERVEAVVCTGDVADHGRDEELAFFEAAWNRVFPDGKGIDGRTVERVCITGNHDVGVMGQHGDPKNRQHHQTFLGEPLVPAFVKRVKGITFICQNWCHGAEARALLKEHEAELHGDKPFFYLQHSHLRGTIPYAWVTDNGKTTEVLRNFPNAVALTGHSHWPLVDERSLWQGEFTALNCGHLRYCAVTGGRENARTFGEVDDKTSQMQPLGTFNDAQAAMVMRVYDRAIVFSRWDAKYALPLGADWVVPWPPNREVSIEARAKLLPPPKFAPGTKVSVRSGQGKNRAGKTVEQVFVEFPNCRVMDGSPSRALDFEVAMETRTFDVVRASVVKRVYSKGFYRAEKNDEALVACAFGLNELPQAPKINDGPKRCTAAYRFVVRPCNSFGAKGMGICSPWTELVGEVV